MQPNLTLFLESTTKITKDNIKYVVFSLFKLIQVRLSTSKYGISPVRSTFLILHLIWIQYLEKWVRWYLLLTPLY